MTDRIHPKSFSYENVTKRLSKQLTKTLDITFSITYIMYYLWNPLWLRSLAFRKKSSCKWSSYQLNACIDAVQIIASILNISTNVTHSLKKLWKVGTQNLTWYGMLFLHQQTVLSNVIWTFGGHKVLIQLIDLVCNSMIGVYTTDPTWYTNGCATKTVVSGTTSWSSAKEKLWNVADFCATSDGLATRSFH